MPCKHCGFEKVVAKGFCGKCYALNKKYSSPEKRRKINYCSVEGCDKRVSTKGLCDTHFKSRMRQEANEQYDFSHPLYGSWVSMKNRCYNQNNHDYRWYGAVGITVCDRWRNDFHAFIEDMGEKPTPKHTLERIDGTKSYSPANCKWATRTEQRRNSKDILFNEQSVIKIRNEVQAGASFAELGRKYGCGRAGILKVAAGQHWSDIGGPIYTPSEKITLNLTEEDYEDIISQRKNGVMLKDLAEKYGCSKATISRIALGTQRKN